MMVECSGNPDLVSGRKGSLLGYPRVNTLLLCQSLLCSFAYLPINYLPTSSHIKENQNFM